MRVLCLLVALLLSSTMAPAQTLPAARPPDSLARQPLAAAPLNAAVALHRMFVNKRHLRTAIVLGTVPVGGSSLLINDLFGATTNTPLEGIANQGHAVGLTLIAGTGELRYYHQYNQEKEPLALLALERHQLSPELKRHLKTWYFWASTLSLAPAPALPTYPPVAARLPVADTLAVDTAGALHRLFARRRHNGHVGLRIGGGLLAVSGIALAIGIQQSGYNGLGASLFGLLGGIATLPILTRGFVLTVAHSEGRARRILQAWQQHHLPKRWARRALVPNYAQPQK